MRISTFRIMFALLLLAFVSLTVTSGGSTTLNTPVQPKAGAVIATPPPQEKEKCGATCTVTSYCGTCSITCPMGRAAHCEPGKTSSSYAGLRCVAKDHCYCG